MIAFFVGGRVDELEPSKVRRLLDDSNKDSQFGLGVARIFELDFNDFVHVSRKCSTVVFCVYSRCQVRAMQEQEGAFINVLCCVAP